MSLNEYKVQNFSDPRDDFQKMRRTQLQILLSHNNVEFNNQAPAVELRRIARAKGLNPNRDYPTPEQIYQKKIDAQHNDNPSWGSDDTDAGLPKSSLIAEDVISETPVSESKPDGGLQGFQPPAPAVDEMPSSPDPDDEQPEETSYEDMNFGKLKQVAKEKGMELVSTTKKEEILEFLNGANKNAD